MGSRACKAGAVVVVRNRIPVFLNRAKRRDRLRVESVSTRQGGRGARSVFGGEDKMSALYLVLGVSEVGGACSTCPVCADGRLWNARSSQVEP